jgi:hypothetical protein
MYTTSQVSNKKIYRKPTAAAVTVFTFCFLLSAFIIFGSGLLLFPYAKQYVNKTVLIIILSIGSFPILFLLFWLTLFFVGAIEKMFGVTFRTKSGFQNNGR